MSQKLISTENAEIVKGMSILIVQTYKKTKEKKFA